MTKSINQSKPREKPRVVSCHVTLVSSLLNTDEAGLLTSLFCGVVAAHLADEL